MNTSPMHLQTFSTTVERSTSRNPHGYDHLDRVEQEIEDRELIARYESRNR